MSSVCHQLYIYIVVNSVSKLNWHFSANMLLVGWQEGDHAFKKVPLGDLPQNWSNSRKGNLQYIPLSKGILKKRCCPSRSELNNILGVIDASRKQLWEISNEWWQWLRQACIEAFIQKDQINKCIVKHYWHPTHDQLNEKISQTLVLFASTYRLQTKQFHTQH